MNVDTITIEISTETAELLKNAASEQKVSLDAYLRNLALYNQTAIPAKLSPQDKSKMWKEIVATYSVSLPIQVDDSRESIYTREDEQL